MLAIFQHMSDSKVLQTLYVTTHLGGGGAGTQDAVII